MHKIAFQADNRLVVGVGVKIALVAFVVFLLLAWGVCNCECAQSFSPLCCHSLAQRKTPGSLQMGSFKMMKSTVHWLLTENKDIVISEYGLWTQMKQVNVREEYVGYSFDSEKALCLCLGPTLAAFISLFALFVIQEVLLA